MRFYKKKNNNNNIDDDIDDDIYLKDSPTGTKPWSRGLHKQHYLKWQSTMPTQNLLQKKKRRRRRRREEEEDVDGKEEDA